MMHEILRNHEGASLDGSVIKTSDQTFIRKKYIARNFVSKKTSYFFYYQKIPQNYQYENKFKITKNNSIYPTSHYFTKKKGSTDSNKSKLED